MWNYKIYDYENKKLLLTSPPFLKGNLDQNYTFCPTQLICFTLNSLTIMSTTIQYKTLTLTVAPKTFRNIKALSKAESVYTPNLFDEHLVNLLKPSASLVEIEQTIFEEKILNAIKTNDPLYSFVWFLN